MCLGSWAEQNNLNTARNRAAASGTSSSAAMFAGYTGTAFSVATEEWSGAGAILTRTFTLS